MEKIERGGEGKFSVMVDMSQQESQTRENKRSLIEWGEIKKCLLIKEGEGRSIRYVLSQKNRMPD